MMKASILIMYVVSGVVQAEESTITDITEKEPVTKEQPIFTSTKAAKIIGGSTANPGDFPWFVKGYYPPGSSSCMSGNIGLPKVMHVTSGQETLIEESSISVTKLTDLHVGDFIQGFDEQLQPTTCKVEAIGQFGHGPLYGNYTDDHFIYNPTTNMVEEHGVDGVLESDITTEDKYEILTDCPLGVDEAGTKFTPIDSDFCGSHLTKLSWSDYILLHKGILRVVRETGTFWFRGSSYPDFELLQEHAPRICETMLQCMKDEEECHHLEKASVHFIENVLIHSARNEAYSAFHNIGRHRELGSVAAAVSGGKSVRK